MRVYFVSCVPAALKLGGQYVGIIDSYERFCEIGERGELVEIVPDGNLQPVNFFINDKFFENPPEFTDVYFIGGDRLVNVRGYYPKDGRLKIILQRKFLSFTVTVFYQCGVFLSCEGADFVTCALPDDYADARAEEVEICGHPCLALYGGGWVCVIGTDGRLIFKNEVEYCNFGGCMEVRAPLYTAADSRLECTFGYDGGRLTLTGSHTCERNAKDCGLVFLFFERVLTGGDFAALLDDDLKEKAGSLKKYLGGYVDVMPPMVCGGNDIAAGNDTAGEENIAGLIYPKGKNVYEVVNYAVDVQEGKISNIRPV